MPSILVVDDSPTIIVGLRRFLGVHGFEVHAPARFVDIHRLIAQHKPEIVLLDLNMPTLSGEQIGTFLKKNGYDGPVIIYSGEPPEKLAAACATIGTCDSVSKGAPLEDLLTVIRKFLKPVAV